MKTQSVTGLFLIPRLLPLRLVPFTTKMNELFKASIHELCTNCAYTLELMEVSDSMTASSVLVVIGRETAASVLVVNGREIATLD